MFNLIMRSVEWNTGREVMPVNRLFEYTEQHLADKFTIDGNTDLDELIKLPCLFMQEGTQDQVAYVGQINRARVVGGISLSSSHSTSKYLN